MASVTEAVTSVAALALKLWHYFKGDQTRAQATLEEAGRDALHAAQVAQSADELNRADAELHRLHEQASARHKP